ncbi:MAG TPA: hypothetical protein VFA55_04010 [Candidatus Kapabacteria bacterium]|nr:hypothetical protein [Candidatus Kapabacteria bacterium]
MALIPTLEKAKNISKEFPERKGMTFEIMYSLFDTHSHKVTRDTFQVKVPASFVPPVKKRGLQINDIVREFAGECLDNWIQEEAPFEKEIELTSEYYQNEVHLRK